MLPTSTLVLELDKSEMGSGKLELQGLDNLVFLGYRFGIGVRIDTLK